MPELVLGLAITLLVVEVGLAILFAVRRRWAELLWLIAGFAFAAVSVLALSTAFVDRMLPAPPGPNPGGMGALWGLNVLAVGLATYAVAFAGGLVGGVAGLVVGHVRNRRRVRRELVS